MNTKQTPFKVYLTEEELPKFWYNITADMPSPLLPYLNPQTLAPASAADMQAIFPDSIIEQEMSRERYIEIPEPVREIYKQYRPSPLYRAHFLEKLLDTPARLYFKYEGANPSGSHKMNTAIAQAFYNHEAGIHKMTTETGAGQWGTALCAAGAMFDIDVTVYMVKVSAMQKPYRKLLMETYGGHVFASPSNTTQAGKAALAENPDHLGSLGLAISEAVEVAATRPDTNYGLGSVLNHVALHQTVIGQEAIKQFEYMDDYPDIVIACNGGGSNFCGIALPFLGKQLKEGGNTQFIAVEPTACPKLTKGKFAYDYADVAKMTPVTPMYTLGSDFEPAGIHAGGLRYHGDSPILSQLYKDGYVEARAVSQNTVFQAAIEFAKTQMILPAPESAHAIAQAIKEALICKETGQSKAILFNVSGHGNFDLTAYENYLSGHLIDYDYEEESIQKSMEKLPKVK